MEVNKKVSKRKILLSLNLYENEVVIIS